MPVVVVVVVVAVVAVAVVAVVAVVVVVVAVVAVVGAGRWSGVCLSLPNTPETVQYAACFLKKTIQCLCRH